jgi:hypothetical protein
VWWGLFRSWGGGSVGGAAVRIGGVGAPPDGVQPQGASQVYRAH